MQKRGISEVVVWIIGLALVLVLIVVVWSVVRVFVGQRVENIESTSFVNMKIIGKDSYVQLSSDELPYLNIKVKREAGSGEVGGIRFVLSDGVNTSSFVSKEEIKELQEKNFKVPVGGLRSVEKVEIAPVFISESLSSYIALRSRLPVSSLSATENILRSRVRTVPVIVTELSPP